MTPVIAAIFGLAFGSFANVVIFRVPHKKSLVKPPSCCPSCGTQIRARDNIPILGWLVLGGRCRSCKARISARYPLVEALTAALFGASFVGRGIADGVFVAGACFVLVVLAFIDLDIKRVPNVIVLPATAAAALAVLGMGLQAGERHRLVEALASGLGAYLLLFVIAIVSRGGMGFGDVKLARFIGLTCGWFGWASAAMAIFTGFIAGGLVGIALLALGRSRKLAIPFAPMLCFGGLVGLFWGPKLARVWLG